MELQTRKCPVCSGIGDTHLYGYPTFVREFDNGPTVKQCVKCDSVFLNPVMTQKAYNEFYGNDEQKKFAQSVVKDNYAAKVSKNDERRAELIQKHIGNPGKILDVGTGRSRFIGLIDNAVGIDISEERIKEAKEQNLPVELCDVYEWNKQVDTVTLFHVLEHILDPNPFLDRIFNILSRNGRLVVEVPNIHDALVGLDRYKKFYYQNAHCSYFAPNTLRNLLWVNKFVVEEELKIQRYSLDNHLHWLFKGKPGKIGGIGFVNAPYSWALKKMNAHDTIFLICRKMR